MSPSTPLSSTPVVFFLALALRLILLAWGVYQDATSAVKYTDIDYFVFTDAARSVANHASPYDRATYRYTPLLAWLLYPTTWGGSWFHFGKLLFALSDLVAGYLHLVLLRRRGLPQARALKYASVWLLNPMVANISTRGSSEGFLCVLVMILLWAFETRRVALAGAMLGVCVHFKIYPFIYGASMLWALTPSPKNNNNNGGGGGGATLLATARSLVASTECLTLLVTSLLTFSGLNLAMYALYGPPFVAHTFTHHLTRIDHRHNFSPYNTLLYLSSSTSASPSGSAAPLLPIRAESLAFAPQLLLSVVAIPLALSRHDLPTTLLAQTLAFVTFNKVCTSQYFLWYLVFLPLYLPSSSLRHNPTLGVSALAAWIAGQAAWLSQGYQLEFLGRSAWLGLFASGLAFFAVNCWILGIVVADVLGGGAAGRAPAPPGEVKPAEQSASAAASAADHVGSKSGEAQASPPTPSTPSGPRVTGRPRKASSAVDVSSVQGVHLGPRNRVLKSN